MRGKRAKAMRRAAGSAGKLEERQRLLHRAALILVEPLLAKSRTGEMSITQESYDLAASLIQKAATISGRLEDAWAQAQLMAEDAAPRIIAQLPHDFPVGSIAVRDEQTWPAELANKPLHQFPRPVAPEADTVVDAKSGVWKRALHQVAHGIAATLMTSEATSVGFSAYGMPYTISDQALGVVAAAAFAAEEQFSIDHTSSDAECECTQLAMRAAISQLDLAPSLNDHETVRRWLERIGRWGDVMSVWETNSGVARLLVARSHRLGFIERYIGQMTAAGRIDIAPADIPILRNQDRVIGPEAGDDVPIWAAAAGALAEAEACHAPILVAPGYWGCEWQSDAHQRAAPVVEVASWLGPRALQEPAMLDASHIDLPEAAGRDHVAAADRGLEIIKREWPRIAAVARAVDEAGWAVVVNGTAIAPEVSMHRTERSMPLYATVAERQIHESGGQQSPNRASTH